MPSNPAVEWMAVRLAKSAPTPRELLDEMISLGMTPQDYSTAKKALRTETQERTTADGRKYRVIVLPATNGTAFRPGFDLRRPGTKTIEEQEEQLRKQLAATRAEARAKRTPEESVKKARERLQQVSPRLARYLRDMTEEAMKDPTKCPACGRGMPRSESIRLQAILGALDRAGVQPPKAPLGEGATGPVLVFPPGTQMAVAVKSEGSLPQSPEDPPMQLRVTRADQL